MRTEHDQAWFQIREGIWIGAAGWLAVAALLIAPSDIHLALGSVALAGFCARRAVVNHRRADALAERANAADLAESRDPTRFTEAA